MIAPLPLAVVFDMDGLIFNSEDLYDTALEALLERRNRRLTPELKQRIMGRPGPVALALLKEHESLDEPSGQLQEEILESLFALIPGDLQLMPGCLELLDRLEALRIPKAIATSSSRHVSGLMLERFGLPPRFEFVMTGEDVEHGKPAPDIYLQTARRLGVPCHQMAVLEDSPTGIQAAVAAGALAIAIPNRHTLNGDFAGARHIFDSLAHPHLVGLLSGTASNFS